MPTFAAKRAGSVRAGAAAAVATVLMVACSGADGKAGTTAASVGQAQAPGGLVSAVTLGPRGVGNIGCSQDWLTWTTRAEPTGIKQAFQNDVVQAMYLGQPRTVRTIARATHGGTVTSPVPVTNNWVIFLEYQQHLQSSSTDFWYLTAVNLQNNDTRLLASATHGRALEELPRYAASGGRVAWNQHDDLGQPVLRIADLDDGSEATLALPPGVEPYDPAIAADSIVFVDNGVDPNRSREDFWGRRGALTQLSLNSMSLATIASAPDAWMPQADAGWIVWTAIQPSGNEALMARNLAGTAMRTWSGQAVTPQTNGKVVVWYDPQTRRFDELLLSTGVVHGLSIGAWSDLRSVFAVCGDALFFALPLAADGGTSTIREAPLGGAA